MRRDNGDRRSFWITANTVLLWCWGAVVQRTSELHAETDLRNFTTSSRYLSPLGNTSCDPRRRIPSVSSVGLLRCAATSSRRPFSGERYGELAAQQCSRRQRSALARRHGQRWRGRGHERGGRGDGRREGSHVSLARPIAIVLSPWTASDDLCKLSVRTEAFPSCRPSSPSLPVGDSGQCAQNAWKIALVGRPA